MMTAIASAFWANTALSDTLHVPRWMSATAPAMEDSKAPWLHPMPSVGRTRLPVSRPEGSGDQLWCTALVMAAPTLGSTTHCLSSGSAVCATLMAPAAEE